MKRVSRFSVFPGWKVLITDMGIDVDDVLKSAGLPADLFNREKAYLSVQEYYRLWVSAEHIYGASGFPLQLARHLSTESFSPPIFACICSRDMNEALKRLQHYKPLIGPWIMSLEIGSDSTRMQLECYGGEEIMPATIGISELVFFTQLARMATRSSITPLQLTLPRLPDDQNTYLSFFGTQIEQAGCISLTFHAEDASKPFLTANAGMWQYFEDKLEQRLKDLTASATATERVRAVLFESLPCGDAGIEEVASRLAISKRTLQRKLTEEGASYQSVLQQTRVELADHYLETSRMPLAEIAFLLGFQECNSFIRAYSSWKGMPPGQFRELRPH